MGGFKDNAQPIHKVNVGFSVVKLILGIVLVGVSITIGSNLKHLTFSDSDSSDEAFWLFEAIFELAKNLGMIAGFSVIVIEAVGILSFFIWSKATNIVHVVCASLIIAFLIFSGVYTVIPAGVGAIACNNITGSCYICPQNDWAVCEINFIDQPPQDAKSCWVYESDYDAICVKELKSLDTAIGLFFTLAVLTFVGAILGCCSCGSMRDNHYHLLVNGPIYNTMPQNAAPPPGYSQLSYAQPPQAYGAPAYGAPPPEGKGF